MSHSHALAVAPDPHPSWPILCPRSEPVLIGETVAHDMVDWTCGHCYAPLFVNVHPESVLEMLVRCYQCGKLSALPSREARPILPTSILCSNRAHYFEDSISAPRTLHITSVDAMRSYRREIGLIDLEPAPNAIGDDREGFQLAAQAAQSLLGTHFARLKAQYERGRKSKNPPTHPHRIVELITLIMDYAERLNQGQSVELLDASAVAELLRVLQVMHRWSNHPYYRHLQDSLSQPHEALHTVAVLALAGVLADYQNPIGLGSPQPTKVGVKNPDLYISTSPGERVSIEVKAPLALRNDSTYHPYDEMLKLVRSKCDQAAKQLRGGDGLVGLAAFRIGGTNFNTLVAACSQYLHATQGRKEHIVGIAAMDFGDILTPALEDESDGTYVRPSVRFAVLLNPSYKGEARIYDGSNRAPDPYHLSP